MRGIMKNDQNAPRAHASESNIYFQNSYTLTSLIISKLSQSDIKYPKPNL